MSFVMVLWGYLLPISIMAAALVVGWRPWVHRRRADARWAGSVGLGLGFAIGYWHLIARPIFPPVNVSDRLFYSVLVIAVLGLLDALAKPPLWARALVLLLSVRLVLWALLWSQMSGSAALRSGQMYVDVISLAAVIWFVVLEVLAERDTGATVPLMLVILGIAVALMLLVCDHIASTAMVAGSITAMCAAAAALGFWEHKLSVARGGVLVASMALLLLLVQGYFYRSGDSSPIEQWGTAILILAPLAGLIGDAPRIRRLRPLWRSSARVLAVLIVVLLGIVRPIRASLAQANQPSHQMEDE